MIGQEEKAVLAGGGGKTAPRKRVLQVRAIATPLGEMRAGADETGLYFLRYADEEADKAEEDKAEERAKAAADHAGGGGAARRDEAVALLNRLEADLRAYFSGAGRAFTVPLVMAGHSAFRRQVWRALAQIPYGETRSYSGQAALIGLPPRFARAVAAANARNPFPIVLPCHRVIGADGGLRGYHGGLPRKEFLLRLEGADIKGGGKAA